MERITITETGCYLDNHRGHFITRDMLWMCRDDFGYIIDQCLAFALLMYDEKGHTEEFPTESMMDEVNEALAWLNCGDNEGLDRPIKGQNSPPIIPEGFAWDWNDGDFGLYPYVLFNIGHEDSSGTASVADDLTMPQARAILKSRGAKDDVIERLLGQSPDDMALQAGGFIVEAISPLSF